MWDLPGSGTEPVFPALAAGFFTTGLWSITAKGYQAQSAKEEQVGDDWGKPGASIQRAAPSVVPKDTLGSLTKQRILHVREMPSRAPWRLSARGFNWVDRRPLHGTCPNSRLSEGKRVLSINHIVFINSLGTESWSYQLRVGTFLKSTFPDTSQGPILQANLFLDSSLVLCIGFTWFQTHFFSPLWEFFFLNWRIFALQDWFQFSFQKGQLAFLEFSAIL